MSISQYKTLSNGKIMPENAIILKKGFVGQARISGQDTPSKKPKVYHSFTGYHFGELYMPIFDGDLKKSPPGSIPGGRSIIFQAGRHKAGLTLFSVVTVNA